jgi:hypothetical protein
MSPSDRLGSLNRAKSHALARSPRAQARRKLEQMQDTHARFGRSQEVGHPPGHEERYVISPGRFGPILYVVGFLLVGLGGVMLVPALVDLSFSNPDWRTFIAAGVVTGFLGGSLVLANQGDEFHLDLPQGFLLTAVTAASPSVRLRSERVVCH